MMKKFIAILIIISNILLLTGCWDSTEIDHSEMVAGIAVDKGKNGFKYHLTAEIINIQPTEAPTESPSRIVETDEDTLFHATRNLIAITSRKLYFGHCKVLIISEEVAKEGILPILDIFIRHYTSSLTVDIVVSKGCEAKEILSQKSQTGSPNGFDVKTMLESNEKSLSHAKKMPLYNTINYLKDEGISLTLPAFKIEKIKDKSNFKLNGTAVFSKDKLVGYLDDEESKYFLFVTDNFVNGPFSLEINDRNKLFMSTLIFSNKTKLKHNFVNNKLSMNLNTKTIATISEMGTYNNVKDDFEYSKLTKQLENELQDNIKSLITKVQNEFDVDIFGFGKYINENDPTWWNANKSNWDKTFKNLKVNVSSEFIIRSTEYSEKEIQVGR